MTSILNYSEEELEVLQRTKDKKWLSNLLGHSSLSANDKDVLSGQVGTFTFMCKEPLWKLVKP